MSQTLKINLKTNARPLACAERRAGFVFCFVVCKRIRFLIYEYSLFIGKYCRAGKITNKIKHIYFFILHSPQKWPALKNLFLNCILETGFSYPMKKIALL